MTTTRGQRRHTLRFPPQPHLKLDPGCVVSSCPIASAFGAQVLYGGGNAVDAAVATSLALAITYPQAGNIGGGGFMMIHHEGEVHMLDYREQAPSRVHPDLYDDEGADISKSTLGALAVAVPGTVAGLAEAHRKFGTWTWSDICKLVAPLAGVGNWLTTRQSSSLKLYLEWLQRFESTCKYYLPNGAPPRPGTLFVQSDLAETLRLIGEQGPDAFYKGPIAELIVAQVKKLGGVLDRDDLAAYRPVWRKPLHRQYRGHDVYLPALPSAGGLVAALALGGAEATNLEKLPYASPEWVQGWARVFRAAFSFGNQLGGDPDHLSEAEQAEVKQLAEGTMTLADFERLETHLPQTDALVGDAKAAQRLSTTHFSILDRDGMAVANTYSINTLFGSKMAVEGGGFLLNNTIADFRIATGPNWYGLLQGDRNRLTPGCRPASSMTPSLVLKGGQLVMAIGGSGGPRITTSVSQVIAGVFGSGLPLSESVRRPRVHHQLFPDDLVVEKGIPASTIERLTKDGHQVSVVNALGIIAAIRRRLDDNELSAVLDSRFGDFW
ncbi:MAG: ggt [Myxococcales bacterium]|nr:ggt [Myxococcales bacterium]